MFECLCIQGRQNNATPPPDRLKSQLREKLREFQGNNITPRTHRTELALSKINHVTDRVGVVACANSSALSCDLLQCSQELVKEQTCTEKLGSRIYYFCSQSCMQEWKSMPITLAKLGSNSPPLEPQSRNLSPPALTLWWLFHFSLEYTNMAIHPRHVSLVERTDYVESNHIAYAAVYLFK